ncbi:hypothetical protein SLEP1_g12081 [Rubroshorea leprosula]|nr:hypothetical protein SLEP1_g12081 [Rubroshorea leprosula]
MSAISVLLHPFTLRFPPKLTSNPNSSLLFHTQIRDFPDRLRFSAVSAAEETGVGCQRTMVRTLVSRDSSNINEDVAGLEQEAVIGGPAGVESTLNRLSKWVVAGAFGSVVLWRHDAEALWFVTGSVMNSTLSVVLKRVFNQERPDSGLRSDPGMPSSHAQSIFFVALFTVISVMEWLGINGILFIAGLLILAFASYLSWLRVSQQLHTMSQVLVGAACGAVFSILWFLSWHFIVLEAFVSSLWVRILVVLGAAGCSLGFLAYVVRNWFRDER